MQIQETSSNTETKKKSLNQQLAEKRNSWKKDIQDIVDKFKEINTLMEGQTSAFSMRHKCVDEIHFLMDIYIKLTEKYKNERWKVRSTIPSDTKYKKDIDEEVDSKTSAIKTSLDLIDSQMNFFKENIKTIDQILYGIKYRLDYENNWKRLS